MPKKCPTIAKKRINGKNIVFMGKKIIQSAINDLLKYWTNQNIKTSGKNIEEIEKIEEKFSAKFPQDIKIYFESVNGMETKYPNYTDSNGFLFYPLEFLTNYQNQFNEELSGDFMTSDQCIIFSDYLEKSWWYGVLTSKNHPPDKYSIIIIPSSGKYKVISSSLAEFINYYINDSPILYDHE